MTYLKKNALRFVLTLLLLWQVWANAHWSVALSITLMFVGLEAVGWAFNKSFGE